MEKGNYTGKGYRVGAYPIHPLVFVLHMQQYRKNVVYRSTTSKPARPDVCVSVVPGIYKLCFSVMSRWVICVQKTKNTERD